MKILFFNFYNGVYAYASGASLAVGGAERQQWLLARALAAGGWSVTVGLQGIVDLETGTTIENVRFVNLLPAQMFLAPYQRFLSLYGFLQSERPDWWYWRCASHLWGPAVALAKCLGIRTIFAAAFDTDVHPRHALVERPYWWPLYAWGLSNTDRIFVQHSRQFFALGPKLRRKSAIIPNMIHTYPKPKPHQERERYVAWVGMLRQPKRPDLLVEIARKAPNLRFVVCGGPSDHRSPKGYAARIIAQLRKLPNVDFMGQVSPDNAQKIISNASVLLCTSEGEGFPNIFLEAWASGTPVVSLTIDPDDRIKRLQLGTISKDINKVIEDLKTLSASPQQREEISVRARRYTVEHHSEDVVTSSFGRAIEAQECDDLPLS